MKSLKQFINESIITESHPSNDFVGLNLLSGTKWGTKTEGKYSFNKIPELDKVPTKKQFEELIKNCKFDVTPDKKWGMFTSKNGACVKLPLKNGVGDFWTSTESEDKNEKEYYAYALHIDNSGTSIDAWNKEKRYNVIYVSK